MILTDDNFATIVGAVAYGRALYDNLLKYLRFQMSTLVAYIAIFIGAGVVDIADGTPLNPLQILWLNMVVDIPLAIALGFDMPARGLMSRPPRPRRAGAGARRLGPAVYPGRRDDRRLPRRLPDRRRPGRRHRGRDDAADHAVPLPPVRGPAHPRPAPDDLRPGRRSRRHAAASLRGRAAGDRGDHHDRLPRSASSTRPGSSSTSGASASASPPRSSWSRRPSSSSCAVAQADAAASPPAPVAAMPAVA